MSFASPLPGTPTRAAQRRKRLVFVCSALLVVGYGARAQAPDSLAGGAGAAWTAQPDVAQGRGGFVMLGDAAGGDSLVRVIVQFVEEPLFLAQQDGFAPATAYESRFAQFEADLRRAPGAGKSSVAASGPDIKEQFYRVFYGASLELPRRMAASIAALPYVRGVYEDAEVRAFLDGSVSQIRADEVWTQLGTRGEGVTVGIIDSGVDYMHPALGGGIGEGHRVVGGYDFVNDDADPMDDNGHGTHVAGIVAADGEGIRGVAPGVRLVVYKVLNDRGRGSTSNIIKAIERAVDPNGDGDPADRLDVVNVSLGIDDGTPDDPAAVAVDNAVRLGVTVVVAAGNAGDPIPTEGQGDNYNYDGSETIGSPGTSALAVTVGAVDDADAMARFSSKGPSAVTFAVKPDVVAPGVGIRSLWPGGGVEPKNGTSMATPHVAGVAALLKALHPDWTPGQIKAALANTAVDVGAPVMQQGAGRIDALRAATVTTHAFPTNLSFGMDDAMQGVWTKEETVWVYNLGSAAQQYTVSFTGQRSGITLSADPAFFSVSAGDSAQVTFTLGVDNRIVPVVEEDIEVYGGMALLSGTVDAIHLPWSFSRTAVLKVTVSEPGASVLGISPGFYFTGNFFSRYNRVRWTTPTTAEVYGSEGGAYDVAAVFGSVDGPDRVVILEGLQIGADGGSISIDAADAVYPVHFDGVDELGGLLRTKPGAQQVLLADISGARIGAAVRGSDSPGLLVSPASRRIQLTPMQVVAGTASAGKVYVPQFASQAGINSELRFSNDPSAYLHQHLRFRLPPATSSVKLYSELGAAVIGSDGQSGFMGFLGSVDTVEVAGGELVTDLFLMPAADAAYTAPSFHVNFTDLADRSDLSTPYFTIDGGRMVAGLPHWLTPTYYRSPSGDTLTFGGSPVYAHVIGHNNSFGTNTIFFRVLPRGAFREDRYDDHARGRYTIYDEGGALVKDAFLREEREPLEVAAGRYRLEIETDQYQVSGKQGLMRVVNRFDLREDIPNAPTILSLQILNEAGKPKDMLAQGEAATLVFSSELVGLNGPQPVSDNAEVYFRHHGTSEWQSLPAEKIAEPTEREGTIFEADLGPAARVDSAAVDLRVVVSGLHDNTAELTLEPAFAVGPWRFGTGGGKPGERPVQPVLHPNFPNPFRDETKIAFYLPGPAAVKLAVYDVLGREVAVLVDERRPAGDGEVVWRAGHLTSGVYFYRLTAGGKTLTRKMALVR